MLGMSEQGPQDTIRLGLFYREAISSNFAEGTEGSS
jgi:hypothetical protein